MSTETTGNGEGNSSPMSPIPLVVEYNRDPTPQNATKIQPNNSLKNNNNNNKNVEMVDLSAAEEKTRRRSSVFNNVKADFKEHGRFTATYKCYRIAAPIIAIIIIVPLVFPPVVTLLPLLIKDFNTITIDLLDPDCDVNLRIGTPSQIQVFGQTVPGILDVINGEYKFQLQGAGLRYICRVDLVIPASKNIHIIARKSARIFGDNFVADKLNIEAFYHDVFILLSMKSLTVNTLNYQSTLGRVDLPDLNAKSASLFMLDRGPIVVSSKTDALVNLIQPSNNLCASSYSMTTANSYNATIMTMRSGALPTATMQQYNITHMGAGPMQIMVFGTTTVLPAPNTHYSMLMGSVFTSPSASIIGDKRNVIVGDFSNTQLFTQDDLAFASINITGDLAPTGVYLWSNRELNFQLLPPLQNILSGGVLRPRSSLTEGILSVCPVLTSDCTTSAGTGLMDCSTNQTAISIIPIDPIYSVLKKKFALNSAGLPRDNSLFAVLARALSPFIIREERSGITCILSLPDKELDPLFPINVTVEGTQLCMEEETIGSNGSLGAAVGLSLAFAIIIAIAINAFVIVKITFFAANASRVDLILSSPETRALARGVMEFSKKFAIVRAEGDVAGCCHNTPESYGCCPGPSKEEVLLPNEIRLNRVWDRGLSCWRDVKIWDIGNIEFVSKLGFIFNRIVVDRDGNLWGPPYGSNGIWCTAKRCGRLVTLNNSLGTLSRYTDFEEADVCSVTANNCMDECKGPAKAPFETDPEKRMCIPCFESIRYGPRHGKDCSSLLHEFAEFKYKVEKLMRLIFYVTNHTTIFYLLEQLFPYDRTPNQNVVKNLADQHRACQHCKELAAIYICQDCNNKRYCKKCHEVLHQHKECRPPVQIETNVGGICNNCNRNGATVICHDQGCHERPRLCGRCDGVLHRGVMLSHHREDLVYCTICLDEALYAKHCGTCGGSFCRACHLILQSVFGCNKAAKSAELEGADDDHRNPEEDLKSGELEFPKIIQTVYYQTCHEVPWEIAVIACQLGFQIFPALPLFVLTSSLNFAYANMFGPSKGPSGHAVTVAVNVINGWAAVYLFVCAGMIAINVFHPSGYEYKLAEKKGDQERQGIERLLHSVSTNPVSVAIRNNMRKTQMQASLYNFIFASNIIFYIFFVITITCSFMYLIVMALWLLLGIFVMPEVALPYATGVVGLVLHVSSLVRRARSFYFAVFDGVKTGMQAIRDQEYEDGSGDPITDLEVKPWVNRFNISAKNAAVAVAVSTIMLLWVLFFVFVGIGAFAGSTQFEAVINSIVTAGATLLVNISQRTEDGNSKAVDMIVEKIITEYKKAQNKDLFSFRFNENLDDVLQNAAAFYKE